MSRSRAASERRAPPRRSVNEHSITHSWSMNDAAANADNPGPSRRDGESALSLSSVGRLSVDWQPPPFFVNGFHDIESVKRMTYKRLGETDILISKLSIGGGPFGGLFGECESVRDIVQDALRHGVTFIDSSYWYGQVRSEELIGQALKRIPRRAYYIATKIGRFELDYARFTDFRGQKVLEAVDSSMCRLGVKYLDLCCIQIHDYEMAPSERLILEETLPALDMARQTGRVRYIGLVGYHTGKILSILSKSRFKIDVVMSCGRGTLADGSLGESMVALQNFGVGVINCAPTTMGLLTPQGPPLWHPAPKYIKDACLDAVDYCLRKRISICRLALHYSMNFPGTASCLVGVNCIEYLHENLDTCWSDLSWKERKVKERIMRRHLDPLANASWEILDVEKYWHKLKRVGITRRSLELALPVKL